MRARLRLRAGDTAGFSFTHATEVVSHVVYGMILGAFYRFS